MSTSTIYTIGFFAALACAIYVATLMRVPQTWIVIGALIANALGIMMAASYTSPAKP